MLGAMTCRLFFEPTFFSTTFRWHESSRDVRPEAPEFRDEAGRHTYTFSAFCMNRNRTLPELA
jgi:hypothetical protein